MEVSSRGSSERLMACNLPAASAARQWRSETADWYLGFTTRMAEFPGYCNELLCEAANAMVDGTGDAIESGFPFLMPWLGHGEEA